MSTNTHLAHSDDTALVRSAREPVRRVVFTVLLVAVMGSGVLLGPYLGLLGGVAFALVGGGAVAGLYNITSRTPKGISSAYNAGAIACPSCGSMQTDLVHGHGAPTYACFNCDHRWA
jgi:hypothetical protein